MKRLLRDTEVADATGIPVQTLRNHRLKGTGPAYHKLGSGRMAAVRYDPNDVEAWLEGTKVNSTSEVPGRAA
jgi:predicted DNA-binding transcriptional regulator AlpA